MKNLFKLFVIPEVKKDAYETQDFYNEKRTDLGERFIGELQEKMEMLESHPEIYARFMDDIRKGNL